MFIVIIMLQIKVREFTRVDTRGPKVQKMVSEVLKSNQATSYL